MDVRSQEMCRLVGVLVGGEAGAGCSLADRAGWLPVVPLEKPFSLSIAASLRPAVTEDRRCDGRPRPAGRARVSNQGKRRFSRFRASHGRSLRCKQIVLQF